jgi:His/Glu/Gln/Arg/opine family amino acid ABC transporter permease subunit
MRFQPILDQWQLIVGGIQVTLISAFFASLICIVVGMLLGVLSQFGHSGVYRVVRAFVYLFRGTPVLVLLFLAYYALPTFGLNLPGMVAGILTFGLNTGAYMTEVTRGALESVDVSQREAAHIDGASDWMTTTRVIFPQAFPLMIAPGTNQLVNLLKGTSLLAVISVTDLTRSFQLVAAASFIPFEAYFFLGVVYLILVGILTRGSILFERWLDRRLFRSKRRSQQQTAEDSLGSAT